MYKSALRGIGASLLLAAGTALAQTPVPALSFEVASIQPSGPPDPAKMMSQMSNEPKVKGSRVEIGFKTLADLICMAYDVRSYQISGPAWLGPGGQRFDIVAKLPAGATKEQVPQLLQVLLAERFKLAIHRVSKPNQIYALIVGKGGPKLKESPPDQPAAPVDGAAAAEPAADAAVSIKGSPESGMTISNGPNGNQKVTMSDGVMHLETSKMSMAQLSDLLSRFMDHPVVDNTGLKGNYQVALDISMEDMMNAARSSGMQGPPGGGMRGGGPGGGPPGGGPPGGMPGGGGAPGGGSGRGAPDGGADPGSSTIFHNVQQLGLKLEPRKVSVDTIVIDSLEKTPTDN